MGHVREFLSVKTALQAAGAGVTRALIGADKRSGRARLAIAGGSAAQALAHVTLPDDVRARLRLTWVDERCVAVTDKDSNRGAAERAGLLPRGGAVTLPLWHDGETPGQACARVAAGLAAEFAGGLDVALLGLGEDGHIASLFPGHPVLLATEPVAHVGDSPKPPADRMTLTLPILRRAGLCVLVATGEGKRAALTRLRRGDDALPATGLERLVVITDLELPDFLAI